MKMEMTPLAKRDTIIARRDQTATAPQGLEYFTFGVLSLSTISMLTSTVIRSVSDFFRLLS